MQDVHYEYGYNIKTRESFTTLDKVINDMFMIKILLKKYDIIFLFLM